MTGRQSTPPTSIVWRWQGIKEAANALLLVLLLLVLLLLAPVLCIWCVCLLVAVPIEGNKGAPQSQVHAAGATTIQPAQKYTTTGKTRHLYSMCVCVCRYW